MAQPRTLPHRPEAENAVLGGVLLRGQEALSEALEVVTEDDFYQPRAQAVFRAMRVVKERGEPIDVVTIEAQLRRTGELELVGGIEGIARLDRYATAKNVKAHAELIAEAAQVRNLVVTTREIAEEGMQEVEDVKAFVAESRSKVVRVADSRVNGSYRSARQVMLTTFGAITERQRRKDLGLAGVTTGFDDLNRLTDGLRKKGLIIWAGRPSHGKTAGAMHTVLEASVCRPKHWNSPPEKRPILQPALVFSLEMTAEELMERALAKETDIDFSDIQGTSPMQEGDFRRLILAGERIAEAPLAFDDEAGLHIDDIEARAFKWRDDPEYWPRLESPEDEAKRIGLIMIDYVQLARGRRGVKYQTRELEIAEISRSLKRIAKKTGCPVLALAQLNRAVDARADHTPQVSDLRESGSLEQDADVILFIHRPERYLPPDAPEDKRVEVAGKAIITIGKQRNGPLGTVTTLFNAKRQKFADIAPDHGGRW